MYRVKIIQLTVDDHITRFERFRRVEGCLEQINAAAEKPDLIMLPEIWGTGFFNFQRYENECETLQGETYTTLAPWAEKMGAYILGGSIIEKEGDSIYNTALLINPNGSLGGRYRKIHLFGYQSLESKIVTAGSDIYTLTTKFGTWGIAICYDLRFPELYRRMVENGVDTFLVVSAWPEARLGHWELLNRARALENLSYLISCNCAGTMAGLRFGGNSMVVDPWGEIICRAGLEEEILSAEIDPAKIKEVRAEFPALNDRRII